MLKRVANSAGAQFQKASKGSCSPKDSETVRSNVERLGNKAQ